MRTRPSRIVIFLLVLAITAAACSKPDKEEAEGTGSTETTAAAGGDLGVTETTGAPAPGAAAAGAPGARTPRTPAAPRTGGAATPAAPGPTTPSLPGANPSYAAQIGRQIKPQSTQRRTPYYNGVTDKVIKLAYSLDEETCGINALTALQAAGGALPTSERFLRNYPTTADQVLADNREAIETVIRYLNEHTFEVAEILPNIKPLLGNDPKNQIYGRHLEYAIVDGGSFQCPEKTTAASKEAAETIKAFSVHNSLLDPSAAYNMAAALSAVPAARRPMHFGSMYMSDSIYNRFAPFAWATFASGTTVVKQWASWICSRVKGQKASRSTDANIAGRTRTFGFVYPNLQEVKVLASEFKGYLRTYCKADIIEREIAYSPDIAAAQTDSTNMCVQLRTGNVTSVIMMTDLLFPLFQLGECERQGFYPEWIYSSFGLHDVDRIRRIYDDPAPRNNRSSFGVTNLGVPGGFGYEAGDAFLVYHTYHQTAPNGRKCDPSSDEGMNHSPQFCKAPANMEVWYYATLAAYTGILYAGPDLTPQNVSRSLQTFPQLRYGPRGPTEDPRPALLGPGLNKYGLIVDATEWRWRPDFKPPPPEDALDGWVEYPDCQRHYILWPDQLAPQWEKGGPHYSAWCGNAKYAPPYSPAKDNYPRLK